MLTDKELDQDMKFVERAAKKAAPYCPHCRQKMKFVDSHGLFIEEPYYLKYQCCELTIIRHYYYHHEDDGWVDYMPGERPRYSLHDAMPNMRPYHMKKGA